MKKTPRTAGIPGLNDTPLLALFINTNCSAITANSYTVPESFNGQPFLGIVADNDLDLGTAWTTAITCSNPVVARETFAVNTCNGCHAIETRTFFKHVDNNGFGSAASLSGFLTGENINDPLNGTPIAFADLDRRAVDLQNLVCQSCRIFGPLVFRPLNMVH